MKEIAKEMFGRGRAERVAPILAAALMLLAAAGCSGQRPAQPGASAPPPRDNSAVADNAVPADNAAAADNGAKVLFRINGEPVTEAEFGAYVRTVGAVDAKQGGKALPILVDGMINNRLMAAMAVQEKLDKDSIVRSRIETRGNRIWGDVLWRRTVVPNVKMTDREMLAQAPKFEELISLQQLVVEDEAAAERIRKEAVAGADFDNLVREHSAGLTASGGGRVGYVKRGTSMYPPKVLEQLFKLKTGEISPVHHTEIGWSVFRLLDRKTVDQSRKEWLQMNRERLLAAKAKDKWEDLKAKLSRKHKVVLNRKVVDAYMKARAENKPIASLVNKSVFRIDDVDFYVGDLVDPSGTGMVHGESTLEVIANKRVNEYAIAREVERLGLKEKEPALLLEEKAGREDILAREFIRHRSRQSKATPQELRDRYEKTKSRYEYGRSIDISLIETRSPARVEKIYAALAKGTPFAEVADEWSDNRKFKGGHVGYVYEDAINPLFAEVRKIPVGEYGKTPIRFKGKDPRKGEIDLYLIAKVNGSREKGITSFEDADKDTLEKAVLSGKREEVVRSILGELRKTNKVEFTPEYDRFAKKFGRMPSMEGRSK